MNPGVVARAGRPRPQERPAAAGGQDAPATAAGTPAPQGDLELTENMAEQSRTPSRLLVIRLSSIGDIVHALPAVAALGESFPQLEIDWLIEKRYASLLAGNPYLRRILPLDTLSWRGGLPPLAVLEEMAGTLRGLRASAYETAVDFQGLWKSALIAFLAGAKERVGLAEPWVRERGAALLYTQRVAAAGRKHVVEESLALAEHLGARVGRWQFPLPRSDADERYLDDELARLEARDFIIINPGGGWKAKRWAPGNYARLLHHLEGRLAWKFLLTGSPDEAGSIAEIIQGAEAKRAFYFSSSLVQFVALARRARLFLGGDTGPLHLAAAVGTPLVAIHGPTDPVRNGPFHAADIALYNHAPVNHTRRNRNATYIEGIAVEQVAAAIEERLARANA